MISFHGKAAVAICPICGKGFPTKQRLGRHTRAAHDPKNIKCTKCSKSFADDPVKLLRHMSIHTGLKPFSCSRCNYVSEKKGNVAIHVKKQHHKVVDYDNDILIDKDMRREMEKIARAEIKTMQQNAAENVNDDDDDEV